MVSSISVACMTRPGLLAVRWSVVALAQRGPPWRRRPRRAHASPQFLP